MNVYSTGTARVVVTNFNSAPLQLYATVGTAFVKPTKLSLDTQRSYDRYVLEVSLPVQEAAYQVFLYFL